MKVGRIEFGLSRDANGKVAPFELHYNRGCCDCTILTLGWFYLTWLSGECRYKAVQPLEELIRDLKQEDYEGYSWGYEDIPASTLEDWTWEELEDKK